MNYRSFADLSDTLLRNVGRLPTDIDLIVGIPRSGLLAANVLSVALNVPLADLDGYIAGRSFGQGWTKVAPGPGRDKRFQRVLLIDDSINSGRSMREAIAQLEAAGLRDQVTTCAVYGLDEVSPDVDIIMEIVLQPRMFQWNWMHHTYLEHACVDIDGVLCLDPTSDENDDGEGYEAFLESARPLFRPTRPIGHLVTSRLEKYRPLTEAWLKKNEIAYGHLSMLDLPSAEERRRQGAHAGFKAGVYRRSSSVLFIESEPDQARAIAQLSGKPVLCVETQDVVEPQTYGVITAIHALRAEKKRRHISARGGTRTFVKDLVKAAVKRR